MEPLATLTAGAIAQLAFSEFVKSGAGEVAKKSLGGAIEIAKHLRSKIATRFKGNSQAEAALVEVRRHGNLASLEEVIKYLDVEMKKDKAFATGLQQVAQQIISYQSQNASLLRQQNINHGRDQNIINQPQGDIRIGGS
jgi:cytochrome c551/c552